MRCAGEGTSTDMMRRVGMPANTRRWPIIVIGILIFLFIAFTVMSGFYVDLLWFREVKLSSVFWSVLRTKFMLGLIFGLLFFALLYVNLLIVRWLTPTTRILTPEQEAVDRVRQGLEPYLRWLIPLAAAALALIVGIGVSRQVAGVPVVAERVRAVVRFDPSRSSIGIRRSTSSRSRGCGSCRDGCSRRSSASP